MKASQQTRLRPISDYANTLRQGIGRAFHRGTPAGSHEEGNTKCMNASSTNIQISAPVFVEAWEEVCKPRTPKLITLWDRRKEYTSEVLYNDDSVIKALADKFKLKSYLNYYCLDAIFFKDCSDRVHCAPSGQTWVHNIRVAFEHEHVFRPGLFQEVSHLLITRADLRVLVSYPNNDEDLNAELRNLGRIISDSDLGRTDPGFLLITGKKTRGDTDIQWRAYTYQSNDLLPLKT